tara:strand:+ start:318 stop:1160 length:843 start_codon:yes stop_codon:yes gene_type:complete
MIIWIASYPKSGNTWVRSIISSLIYSENGDFNFELLKKIKQFPEKEYFKDITKDFHNFNEIKKNWILAQDKINLQNQTRIFKTHQGKYTVGNDNFTNLENTLAVIYVVRDPRNLIKSIANHFTLTNDQACKFLMSPEVIGNGRKWEERKDGIYTLLGKWNDHYRSWTRNRNNLLIIRYEDLVNDTFGQLNEIIKFLQKFIKFETNLDKNKKIIETTSFENLQKMEKQGKFRENVLNKNTKSKVNFFHLGPKNKWKDNLQKEYIDKIEISFNSEMKELGYL